jgi:ribosomal protein S15P/S13E
VVEIVEHLPSNQKDLSSKTVLPKMEGRKEGRKRKKEREKERKVTDKWEF